MPACTLLVAIVLFIRAIFRLAGIIGLALVVLGDLVRIPLLILGSLLEVGRLLIIRHGLPFVGHALSEIAEAELGVVLGSEEDAMSVIYKLAVTSSANDVTVALRKGKAKEKRFASR